MDEQELVRKIFSIERKLDRLVEPEAGWMVKVSGNDTTPGFLIAKLAAGAGITITEVNDGGDEDAQIACSLNGVPQNGIILWINSDI